MSQIEETPDYTKDEKKDAKETLVTVISLNKENIKRLKERLLNCSKTTYIVRVTPNLTAGVNEDGVIKLHSNIEAIEMPRSLAKKVMDVNFNRPVHKKGKTTNEKFKPYCMEIASSHFLQMKEQEEKSLEDNRLLLRAFV